MVNNYDRIYAEIKKEAGRSAQENIESDILVNLVMEIVSLEDQHRVKPTRINQLIEDKIVTFANQMKIEES